MEFRSNNENPRQQIDTDIKPASEGILESEVLATLDKYLEKMVLLKKNFLVNQYKTKDVSSQNKSVLSQAEIIDEPKEEMPEGLDKSVSTEVSIYKIIENMSDNEDPIDNKNDHLIENYNYSRYLQKAF